jgi:di/tricarboxylate transporter
MLMPKTRSGKLSLVLIAAMPILLYIGSSLTDTLYKSTPAGRTILEDIAKRPALALTMLTGMATGVSAFIVGVVAIVRQKERTLLVYAATLIGMLFTLFLIGEILFPH